MKEKSQSLRKNLVSGIVLIYSLLLIAAVPQPQLHSIRFTTSNGARLQTMDCDSILWLSDNIHHVVVQRRYPFADSLPTQLQWMSGYHDYAILLADTSQYFSIYVNHYRFGYYRVASVNANGVYGCWKEIWVAP